VLLAIVAFALSLLGTFPRALRRAHLGARLCGGSGARVFILALFVLLIGGALALFAWRTARIGWAAASSCFRGEVGAASEQRAARCRRRLGDARHALPAGARRARVGKISVGPPYFEACSCR